MHKICHIEIPTNDKSKSKEFYSKVFDWKIEEMDDYMVFSPSEGVGGGFDTKRKPCADGVVLYIEVEEIEKKLKEIEDAGGKIDRPKTKISDEYGYFAIFQDPLGNLLGLWSKT